MYRQVGRTVSLLYACPKLIRHLYRTGTLTENKMQVVSVYTFGAEDTPITARDKLVRRENTLGIRALQILASVCNAAKVCDWIP